MKYKVGDIVTIDSIENLKKKGIYDKKDNDIIFPEQYYIFTMVMQEFCGRTAVIVKYVQYHDNYRNGYCLEDIPYVWTDIMFSDKKREKFEFVDLNLEF